MKNFISKKTNFLMLPLICLIIAAVLYAVFDGEKNQALALSANYNKISGNTLTSEQWNNLDDDFVAKSGDTINGNLTINGSLCFGTVCQSSWPAAAATYWTGAGGNISSTNAGNVGIGMANPTQKLEISGGSVFINNGSSDSNLYLGADANTSAGRLRWDNNNSKLYFGSNGNDRIVIDNAGNVGIGTPNPLERLDVDNGTVRARNIIIVPTQGVPANLHNGMMWIERPLNMPL
jgi:hypothetical protein